MSRKSGLRLSRKFRVEMLRQFRSAAGKILLEIPAGTLHPSETPLAWNPDHTNPPGGLENYYRNNVIGGPGAFVLAAQNFNSFGQAIVKKMIAEVAQAHELLWQQASARHVDLAFFRINAGLGFVVLLVVLAGQGLPGWPR